MNNKRLILALTVSGCIAGAAVLEHKAKVDAKELGFSPTAVAVVIGTLALLLNRL